MRNKMNKYYVGLTVYNTFVVEASSREDAEEKVRNLSMEDTLDCADYEIVYVDELKEE
tara:strand:- start:989 stop:1162 length:174 start_codon:yes stop_codon:yes gene_type:complete